MLAKELATGGYGTIRAKGFVLDHSGQRWLIQIMGERCDITPAALKELVAVVCIGRKNQLKAA